MQCGRVGGRHFSLEALESDLRGFFIGFFGLFYPSPAAKPQGTLKENFVVCQKVCTFASRTKTICDEKTILHDVFVVAERQCCLCS
jgi:hypothetical protein